MAHMKVLLITETLYEGGSELFVLRLARGLLSAGVEVQVLSLNKTHENKEMTALFTDVSVKRLSLPFLPILEFADKVLLKLNIDFSFRYYWQAKQVKKFAVSYEVIHTHYIQVDHLIASLKNKLPFKHVVTVHGDYSKHYNSFKKGELRLWLKLDKKLELLADKVDQWIVISEEQRLFFADVMKISADKVVKIYNGYRPVSAIPVVEKKDGVFTFGMVARGIEQKGWQLLIDTFLKFPVNTKLLLVGGSEYLDGLKLKYAGESRIVFTGFQPDPISWMIRMDVFVLPTYYDGESLPTAVMEALYCGLPVVATNMGEIERMITDNTTGKKAGFVIDFDGKNLNQDQLYERMKYLYDNPEVIQEMKKNAKVAFSKFNMEECVSAYLNEYQKLLSQ
jgi:glycosyltransferase involved in cell wall biosynthesis